MPGLTMKNALRSACCVTAGMSALALAGSASAGDVVPPKVPISSPTGVNISDGTFVYREVDLSIGTIELERHHSYTQSTPRDPSYLFYGPSASNNFDIWVDPIFVPAVYQDVDGPGDPQDPNDPNDPGDPKQIMLFPQHYKPVVHIGMGASGLYRQDKFNDPVTIIPNNGEAEKGTLTYSGGVSTGAYVYTAQDGTVYTFNPNVHVRQAYPYNSNYIPDSQRVSTIVYPDGRVRSFSYDSSSQLKMVSDSTGYAIIFDWGSNGAISQACAFDLSRIYVTVNSTCASAAYKVSYAYSGAYLTSSTDVDNRTTNYTNAVFCVKPPAYTSCKVTNNWPSEKQLTQTLADGSAWHFGWGSALSRDTDYIPANGDNEAYMSDPLGKTTSFIFTGTTLNDMTDANGNHTHYVYIGGSDYEQEYFTGTHTDGTLLTEVDFPEGNKYLQENFGPYRTISKQTVRAKPGSTLADISTQISYACPGGTLTPTCTLPTTKTDANGNVTNYDYYSFGGIKSEMQPSPVPPALWTGGTAASDMVRPLKLYDYVQKYASIKDSSGALVMAATPVWLPNSETECQTVAGTSTAACDTTAPIKVTTYEYGANGTADNLLLRGKVVTANGLSLRTCYGYDAQSNKIWETGPRGTTSASCS